MEEKNTENLKRLKHILLTKDPVLFTGAGFSLGATCNDGTFMPSGNVIKEKIIKDVLKFDDKSEEYKELSSDTLQNVCEFANCHHKNELQDYLTSIFYNCTPQDYHKVIISYGWSRIYTTNIDDLVEHCLPQNKLLVQNLNRIKTGDKTNKTEYLKLHGCVLNQEAGYVFSEKEYIDSIIKSRDYRFSCYGQDIQYKDFVFIGTDYNEINLDYYLNLYENAPNQTSRGYLFFINPSKKLIFRSRVEKIGGIIIDITSEAFAEFLKTEVLDLKKKNNVLSLKNFSILNNNVENLKKFKAYRSNLYVGDVPKWLDILNDWDFQNSSIMKNFLTYYDKVNQEDISHSIYTIVGKSLTGKSTYSRRIAYFLYNEGYVVLEFTGKDFEYFSIVQFCKSNQIEKLCILIDNASYYYGAFRSLLNSIPDTTHLIILANTRPYFHNRKKYNIITEDYFETYVAPCIPYPLAKEIENKLFKKGYLGSLKKYDKEERIKIIQKSNDIPDCLYSITYSKRFVDRFLDDLSPRYNKMQEGKELLSYLVIFHELELSYLPLEIVTLIFQDKTKSALSEIDDFIKFNESNGIAIRSSAISKVLLNKITHKERLERIKELLINISPQVSEREHTYWNEIEACLLKEKLLRKRLSLKTSAIRNMLFEIQDYYFDSYNYWIQVGITEQFSFEFEKALNHFHQAEALNSNSYMVQNAIARNFLKQANYLSDYEKARPIFEEGEERMLDLIRNREEFQVKAFSTHCYLYEKINFYTKFEITPSDDELRRMFDLLKQIIDKMPEDGMSKHISNKFYGFLQHFNKTNVIKLDFRDLTALRLMFKEYDINIDSVFEDFEID